ncbi:MAG: DUF3078 domain-containing protein [Rikenellaceae bacterium]
MRKFFTLLLAMTLCTLQFAEAQEGGKKVEDQAWKLGGNLSVSLNQASFSNWASGGENAVGVAAQVNYSADYKADGHIWNNRLELAYGLNDTESIGSRKTNDKIYLSSTYGREIAKNLYVSGLLTFQTQFANGYSYDSDANRTFISTFMAPGYLTVGAGLTWTPNDWFTTTLTPVTWREVFVLDEELSDAGAYGVDAGERAFAEAGANWQMEVKRDIMKNVKLYSRLTLFSDYLSKPQNVDVNWEVQLNMTINKWLSAFVTGNLVYDDNITILRSNGTSGPDLQIKETLGIGLSVTL